MIELKESDLYRINHIMENYDFEKVHNCMKKIDWVWAIVKSADGIPNIEELKKTAKRLLTEALIKGKQNKFSRIGTGGFQATYENDVLELSFILTEWDDVFATEDKNYQNIVKKENRLEKINKMLNE